MTTRSVLLACFLPLAGLYAAEDNWVSLFNGRDLSGWVNVNCAPETWTVQNGLLHCTGKPTGALRTPKQYENFVLELDWRHLSNGGNSGVFIWSSPIGAPGVPFLRAIEVQVLDNGYNVSGRNQWYTTHGDVFPIHGSTMSPFGRHNGSRSFPSEERSNSSPDWNHYQISCRDGVIRLSVNGKEVSGGENCSYRKGYIGLESEGGPIDFRNIRIQELPPSGAAASATAPDDLGWHSLFTGLDLRGWRTNNLPENSWKIEGEVMKGSASGSANPAILWTEQSFAGIELVIDCRLAGRTSAEKLSEPSVYLHGENGPAVPLRSPKPGEYHRFVFRLQDQQVTQSVDGGEPERVTLSAPLPANGPLGIRVNGSPAEFRNLYFRSLAKE